jgi:hypothetical protein
MNSRRIPPSAGFILLGAVFHRNRQPGKRIKPYEIVLVAALATPIKNGIIL